MLKIAWAKTPQLEEMCNRSELTNEDLERTGYLTLSIYSNSPPTEINDLSHNNLNVLGKGQRTLQTKSQVPSLLGEFCTLQKEGYYQNTSIFLM